MADYNTQNSATVNAVNTNSIALFAADSTMLRIAFRNESMFITIIPKVADPNGGRPRWPKEMGHTAALRPQTAYALYKGFMSRILPDIEAGADHPGYCAVPLNREASNLCGFSYAGGNACFTIFNNVAADRTCNEYYTFMFDPTLLVNDYNPTTGSYKVESVQGQLFVIVEGLRIFGENAINALGHGVKNATSWNNDMMLSHLRAIATRVGATPAQYGSYRGNFSGEYTVGRFDDGSAPQNDGDYGSNGQASLQQPTTGDNGTMTWSAGFNESASVGHTNVPPIQQVSSLETLMNS